MSKLIAASIETKLIFNTEIDKMAGTWFHADLRKMMQAYFPNATVDSGGWTPCKGWSGDVSITIPEHDQSFIKITTRIVKKWENKWKNVPPHSDPFYKLTFSNTH